MDNRPVPSPNAFDFYRAAHELLTDDPLPRPHDEEADEYTVDEKRSIVERNSEALRMLRGGFEHEFLVPSGFLVPPDLMPSDSEITAKFGCRRLAQLLRMESELRSAEGDPAGAMSSLLDAIHLGSDLPRGGLVIDSLVGRAVEAIGLSQSGEIIDRLDAESARTLARRAESSYRRSWSFAETIEDERRVEHRQLLQYCLNPLWKYIVAGVYTTDQGWLAFMGAMMRLLPRNREALFLDHERYVDSQVTLARMPFSKAQQQPEVRGKLITYYMGFDARSEPRVAVDNGATQKAFLAVALTLRAYWLDHGAYPDDLSYLVPDYLSAVPNDPFAGDAPLRYRIEGERYMLYSIGPDGVDDGGTPISTKPAPRTNTARSRSHLTVVVVPAPNEPMGPGYQHRVHADSKGDIVAGVNR